MSVGKLPGESSSSEFEFSPLGSEKGPEEVETEQEITNPPETKKSAEKDLEAKTTDVAINAIPEKGFPTPHPDPKTPPPILDSLISPYDPPGFDSSRVSHLFSSSLSSTPHLAPPPATDSPPSPALPSFPSSTTSSPPESPSSGPSFPSFPPHPFPPPLHSSPPGPSFPPGVLTPPGSEELILEQEEKPEKTINIDPKDQKGAPLTVIQKTLAKEGFSLNDITNCSYEVGELKRWTARNGQTYFKAVPTRVITVKKGEITRTFNITGQDMLTNIPAEQFKGNKQALKDAYMQASFALESVERKLSQNLEKIAGSNIELSDAQNTERKTGVVWLNAREAVKDNALKLLKQKTFSVEFIRGSKSEGFYGKKTSVWKAEKVPKHQTRLQKIAQAVSFEGSIKGVKVGGKGKEIHTEALHRRWAQYEHGFEDFIQPRDEKLREFKNSLLELKATKDPDRAKLDKLLTEFDMSEEELASIILEDTEFESDESSLELEKMTRYSEGKKVLKGETTDALETIIKQEEGIAHAKKELAGFGFDPEKKEDYEKVKDLLKQRAEVIEQMSKGTATPDKKDAIDLNIRQELNIDKLKNYEKFLKSYETLNSLEQSIQNNIHNFTAKMGPQRNRLYTAAQNLDLLSGTIGADEENKELFEKLEKTHKKHEDQWDFIKTTLETDPRIKKGSLTQKMLNKIFPDSKAFTPPTTLVGEKGFIFEEEAKEAAVGEIGEEKAPEIEEEEEEEEDLSERLKKLRES